MEGGDEVGEPVRATLRRSVEQELPQKTGMSNVDCVFARPRFSN